jgi:hypothetical protein
MKGSELLGKIGFSGCLFEVGGNFEGVGDKGSGVGVAEDRDSIDICALTDFAPNWRCTDGLHSDGDLCVFDPERHEWDILVAQNEPGHSRLWSDIKVWDTKRELLTLSLPGWVKSYCLVARRECHTGQAAAS